jgi:hypothetical protein
MPDFSPLVRLPTVTTVVMPMTMPRIVSALRKRWLQTASSAIPRFSPARVATIKTANYHSARSASTGSMRAARAAGYQPDTTPTADDTNSARKM